MRRYRHIKRVRGRHSRILEDRESQRRFDGVGHCNRIRTAPDVLGKKNAQGVASWRVDSDIEPNSLAVGVPVRIGQRERLPRCTRANHHRNPVACGVARGKCKRRGRRRTRVPAGVLSQRDSARRRRGVGGTFDLARRKGRGAGAAWSVRHRHPGTDELIEDVRRGLLHARIDDTGLVERPRPGNGSCGKDPGAARRPID